MSRPREGEKTKVTKERILVWLIPGLGFFALGLLVIAVVVIVASLSAELRYDQNVDWDDSIVNIYTVVVAHSLVGSAAFVVGAVWATLLQWSISAATLHQVNQAQMQERNAETLEQCRFFLVDVQLSFKALIDTGVVKGLHAELSRERDFKDFTREQLKEAFPELYQRLENLKGEAHSQVLLTLYQTEAFAALVLQSNLDIDLAQKMIGPTYVKQVGFLIGFVAWFRTSEDPWFGQNILDLYTKWKPTAPIEEKKV